MEQLEFNNHMLLCICYFSNIKIMPIVLTKQSHLLAISQRPQLQWPDNLIRVNNKKSGSLTYCSSRISKAFSHALKSLSEQRERLHANIYTTPGPQ